MGLCSSLLLLYLVLVCFVNDVLSGRTSSFTRSEWPSTDIPLDNEAFVVPDGYNAPQQFITMKFQRTFGGVESNPIFIKNIENVLLFGTALTKGAKEPILGRLHPGLWIWLPILPWNLKLNLCPLFVEMHEAPIIVQVHITQGDYDGKAVIISWVTESEPGTSEVWYGAVEHEFEHKAEGKNTNYTFYNYKSGYIHHCLVDGLEYNTKYYYRIGTGATAREFWFQTPPEIDPDAPYIFGIIGDLGQTFNSLSTLEHYMQTGGQTVLFVGDLSYADRYEYNDGVRWDSWGRLIEKSAAYQPWIWTAGNHDIDFRPDLGEVSTFKPYMHRFATPYVASQSSSPLWYAVRRASAHIIVLSSYSPFVKYTPQWFWLRGELKQVNREKTPWLIVLMHVPMYNSNEAHYMEGEAMRAVFESWFVHYKVDIVFAGHVHAYERSYRVSNINYNITSGNRYPVPDKSAPVYITVGDGGNQEGLAERFSKLQPDYSAYREASYGHSTLELKNRTHALYHWNRNDDGKHVPTDHIIFHNQYWASNRRRRSLKKHRKFPGHASLIAKYEELFPVLA